jgi:cytochrome c biogenesis protein
VLPRNDDNIRFAQLSLSAVSDALLFGAPLLVSLKDYQEVKASVFQVTRSPGKTTVYVGCLLLTLGIFAMLYIQERRIWVWLSPKEEGATLKLAATTPRLTMDFQKEFSALSRVVSGLAADKSDRKQQEG